MTLEMNFGMAVWVVFSAPYFHLLSPLLGIEVFEDIAQLAQMDFVVVTVYGSCNVFLARIGVGKCH